MTALGEEAFRALLDERGILRPGELAPPERSAAYAVFVQRKSAAIDVAALKSHAAKFFETKLGLTVDKHYRDEGPREDAARIVIAGPEAGTRLCFARPVEPVDLAAAESAERAQGTFGMALLAQRCPTLWLIERESEDDRVALTIAAILASALLGPILSPRGNELFGVRTARLKLAR